MRSTYLLDLENVGFESIDPAKMKKDDYVYIFYSENTERMDIQAMDDLQEKGVNIYFKKILTGKDALDLQLSSYLGFLISQNKEKQKYNIISRDHGYDVLSSFWADKNQEVKRSDVFTYDSKNETKNKDTCEQDVDIKKIFDFAKSTEKECYHNEHIRIAIADLDEDSLCLNAANLNNCILYMMYTEKASKIDASNLDTLLQNNVTIRFVKKNYGKENSLFQMASYIGYLIGENIDSFQRYTILAKESEALLQTMQFWRKRNNTMSFSFKKDVANN